MPVALTRFTLKSLRLSFAALPHQPRGVWVAGIALVVLAVGIWAVVGGRLVSAHAPVATLYPSAPVPVEMMDVRGHTVAQVIEGLPIGLKFEMLLKRTGTYAALAGAGPVTVFVPGDNYFDYIGLPSLSRTEEKALAARHVVPHAAVSTESAAGTYITLGGDSIAAAWGQGGTLVVDKGFAIRGYYAKNGVVYLVSRVLTP